MTITQILDLYENNALPANVEELTSMQTTVDNYASSSLGSANAAQDPTMQNLHFNDHVTCISISNYLDYKIRSVHNMKGGSQ